MYQFIALHKHKLQQFFWVFYILWQIVFIYGAYSIAIQSNFRIAVYAIGKLSGDYSLLIFCVVLIPGIFRRFGLRFRWVHVILWFRRQLGIVTFLLAFMHFSFIRLIAFIFSRISDGLAPGLFEQLGLIALLCMFLLFITSNDISIKFLKRRWYFLQKAVYIVAWLIFGHVVFLGFSGWTILILSFAVLESVSLLYAWIKSSKKSPKIP